MAGHTWDPRSAIAPPGDLSDAWAYETAVHACFGRPDSDFHERKGHVFLELAALGPVGVSWRRTFSWMRHGQSGWDEFMNNGAYTLPPEYGLPRARHEASRRWPASRLQVVAVIESLCRMIERRRYRALWFNCTHFAWTLLGNAGIDPNEPPTADGPREPRLPISVRRGLGSRPPLWPRTIPRLVEAWHLREHDSIAIPENVG